MKSIFAAIVAVAITTVSAQTNIVSITSPLTGTVYTAGQDAIISWIDPQVTTISKIVLAQGAATSLQPVSTIATNVDASSLSYTWSIPSDTAAGTDYALELGTSPNVSYTALFTIQAASGSSASSSSSTTAASGSSSSTAAAASGSSTSKTSSASSAASSAASSSSSTSAGFKVTVNQAVAGMAAVAVAAMMM
ncbi:hypothetical protein G6F46_012842 [Rhizopus delemar]|nr:hypothetical protein G6F46_012842 [Rhizopus delemar]